MDYESNYDDTFFEDFDKLCSIYQTVPYFKERLKFYWQLLACTMHNLKDADLQASFRFSWEENEVLIQEKGQLEVATFSLDVIESEFNHGNKRQFYEEWYEEVLSCLLSLRSQKAIDSAISLDNIIFQTYLPGAVPVTLMDYVYEKTCSIYFNIYDTSAYVTPTIQAYFGVSMQKLLEIAGKNTAKKYPLAAKKLEDVVSEKTLHGLSDFIKHLPVLSVTHDSFCLEMIYYPEFLIAIKHDIYMVPLTEKDMLLLDTTMFSEHSVLKLWEEICWYPLLTPYRYEIAKEKLTKVNYSDL